MIWQNPWQLTNVTNTKLQHPSLFSANTVTFSFIWKNRRFHISPSLQSASSSSSCFSPSTMLVLAKKPDEAFKAPLNTKKQAPVTVNKRTVRTRISGKQSRSHNKLETTKEVCLRTFAWLVVDADGLRLVVPVIVLHTHQVGVGAVVETRPHGQHVFVGLVHSLHKLKGQISMAN